MTLHCGKFHINKFMHLQPLKTLRFCFHININHNVYSAHIQHMMDSACISIYKRASNISERLCGTNKAPFDVVFNVVEPTLGYMVLMYFTQLLVSQGMKTQWLPCPHMHWLASGATNPTKASYRLGKACYTQHTSKKTPQHHKHEQHSPTIQQTGSSILSNKALLLTQPVHY